ncbi:recombinase family protein [Neobacillus niacini]|uniref:recombinase family protein n=1 Tax=Neobacillus niacini TaxID=86668 RepID=UPI0007AC18C3|nr:recombinase family protein [Neobacillus niacini]MEC1526086.1 recombinase family protein [Neobacillus niacini]
MIVIVKTAVGYCRRSSSKQKGNHSIEFQKEQIILMANRMGYVIEGWCIDDAVSAFKTSAGERKGLKELYDLVLNDKASAVFFYDETRIDRSIVTFVNEIYKPLKLVKPNVKFYSTTSNQEWDPFQIDVELKLINASYESVTKSQRTIDSQKNLMNQKKRPGSRTPFGLKKIPSSDVQNENFIEDENASLIRFIYYLYIWGYSIKHITKILHNSQAPAPGGKVWHRRTVEEILKRPLYRGDNEWGSQKNIIKNPVIEPELYELVLQAKDLEKKFGQFSTAFTFRSIAYCMKCNVPLKTRNDTPSKATSPRKYQNYFCPNCNQKANLNRVHTVVNDNFFKHWAVALRSMEQAGLQKLKEMKKVIEKELDRLKVREDMLKYNESFIPSLETPSSIEKHYIQVKAKLNSHREALNNTLEQILNLLEDERSLRFTLHLSLSGSFNKLTDVEKRMIALTFIGKISINMDTMKVDIDYRLHPFIELEDKVSRLTEINNYKMDA